MPASPNNLFLRLPFVPLEAHLLVSHVPHRFQIQLRSGFPSFIQAVQNREVLHCSQAALPTSSSSCCPSAVPAWFATRQPGRSQCTGGAVFTFLFWAPFAFLAFSTHISVGTYKKCIYLVYIFHVIFPTFVVTLPNLFQRDV